jgi:hypothetical protein
MSHLGAALFPNHGNDKSQILHHADLALGAAMERNKDFIFYHDDLREQVVEKMELQNSIIKAIEAPALEKIDINSKSFSTKSGSPGSYTRQFKAGQNRGRSADPLESS